MGDKGDARRSWENFLQFTGITQNDEDAARFNARQQGRRSASAVGGGSLTWTPPRHYKHKHRLIGESQ